MTMTSMTARKMRSKAKYMTSGVKLGLTKTIALKWQMTSQIG